VANQTTTPIMPSASGPGGPFANPIYLVDQYGNPITPSNGGAFNLAQVNGNTVATPNGSNNANATQLVTLGLYGGGSTVTPQRDFTAVGGPDAIGQNVIPAVQAGYSGTSAVSFIRVANVFKAFNAQALTASSANTPTSIWTPAAGKKFHLMGYWFSLSAAAGLVFHDLASVGGGGLIPLPSPVLTAAGIVQTPPIGNGYLSAATNNQLWIDATAAATVTGFVWGIEE
jgi:hypothetical protein